MQKLTNKQLRHLKSIAHGLKPVVIVGDKGLTQAVIDEIGRALETHELVKVKIRTEEREERELMLSAIVQKTGAAKVQRVGHIVTLFKRNQEAKVALPQ